MKKLIIDATTGQSHREDVSDEELGYWANVEKNLAIEAKEMLNARATAEAKLAALGLTADDLKALGL